MQTQKILLGFEPKKENLLPAVKEINERMGYVDEKAIEKVARYFGMAESEVFSAISFYDDINLKKGSDFVIKICDGANCVSKGGERLVEQVETFFHQKVDDENNPRVKIERVSCQGLCLIGPILKINSTIYEKVKPENVDDILRNYFG